MKKITRKEGLTTKNLFFVFTEQIYKNISKN